ncbi:hypothetical protein J437_LFUL004415 [Ladona fulva]|uniref:Uncharacterized protein n=1 Tax=Ladona fulva TaxID=123851 RepID=A0A8K0JWA9_LADFU|nr:hypothetical protein J437_LFUL004415 [Ladona fulva]
MKQIFLRRHCETAFAKNKGVSRFVHLRHPCVHLLILQFSFVVLVTLFIADDTLRRFSGNPAIVHCAILYTLQNGTPKNSVSVLHSPPPAEEKGNGGGAESAEGAATDGVRDGSASSLQEALAGESFAEKERRLSEMILQLQMVREQLLAQQEQQSKVWCSAICVFY